MTNNILTAPTVSVVGGSFFMAGLRNFIASQSLEPIAENADTPLGKITQELSKIGGDRQFSDLELLPEFAGRFCYRSWEKGRSTAEYNQNILEMEHGSVLEHSTISFAVTGVSRSLTHELIRHRVGTAISQESQRYVDAKDINFVVPPLLLFAVDGDLTCGEITDWHNDQLRKLEDYEKWQAFFEASLQSGLEEGRIQIDGDIDALDIDIEAKRKKQMTRIKKRANEAARADLPNATETRLVWTVNLRTLRHFIMLRGDDPADLEIRRLAVEVAKACMFHAPTLFADIEIVEGSFGVARVVGKHKKV